MFGVILTGISAFFREISTSVGKVETGAKKESIFTMGFLNSFWSLTFFIVLIFIRHSFVFSLASLPTFMVRVILEIVQMHTSLLATIKADRTTFGFLNVITIPLLLLVDIILGYSISTKHILGIGIIFIALFILFINHGIKKSGAGYVLFASINAVATISLFKYDITHFNSVEAEQSIIIFILLIYLFFGARLFAKENPFLFFKKPAFLLQSSSSGVGEIIQSFAYLFAPASVITSGKRSFSVVWSLIFGKIYFHERHILFKIFGMIFLILGIFLLI